MPPGAWWRTENEDELDNDGGIEWMFKMVTPTNGTQGHEPE